jgi:hypothetical protein
MARRNFWDSFYQGWNQGDRIYERNRGLQQRAEFKKIAEENPTDVSQYDGTEFQDDAEKQGGVWDAETQSFKLPNGEYVAPTNTPTWDEGTKSYQNSFGQPLKPKAQFKLGNMTQDRAFTPEQVNEYKTNRYADVYAANGEVDKAMGLRNTAQQMKIGKVQLDNAELMAKEAASVRKLMDIQGKFATGEYTAADVMKNVIPITDKANGDGITHGYRQLEDGKIEVTEMRNDEIVGSKVVDVQEVLKRALKYASPTMFAQMTAQENSDRDFNQRKDQFSKNFDWNKEAFAKNFDLAQNKMTQDREQYYAGLDQRGAIHNDEMQLRRAELASNDEYRRGIVSRYGSDGLNALQDYQLKQLQEYDAAKAGIIAELDAGKITDVEATRRIATLGMKYGAARPMQEPKDNKAQEVYLNFVKDNPDATPAQLEMMQRRLGLAPALQYGKPVIGEAAPAAKPGGLTPKKAETFREALQGKTPDWIEEHMANPLYNGVPITGEDQLYAAQVINGLRAGQKLTPGYLR